ncbi:HelD family protein [Corynebacterium freiburgense]|uniref:HelD family protein n=1 Tax=Corynebacterium freiburgense TaxID=556548 RepID=UPI000419A952|nr:UvrD-helicase domain-containing protein [Corynebacterium freiburgense]WJZ02511.1 Helicase IV [Corynebacterium freiburgense]
MEDSAAAHIAAEQTYVDALFARLDAEVQRSNERLAEVMLRVDRANPDAEALVEREIEYHALNAKLDRLNLAQLGLVFGRIDIAAQTPENPAPNRPDLDRRYIGRMGLDAREENYRTLLLDWRAPMARPFYLATTANPEGVETRRHIRTKGRKVVGIDDEFLNGAPTTEDHADVSSEAALFRALEAARTGYMTDIVETIQREQDEIIRDTTRGVMVVEGGPGTGKTAVALHRVAYLLYTWRDLLAKTGVLIIGPNRTFLDYISRVLPELGETGVVLSTIGDLYPGVQATAEESLLTREIKGSEEMVHILGNAVKAYQTLPEAPLTITVDGIHVRIDAALVKKSRTRARRSRQPHNRARAIFRDHMLEQMAQALAETIGADPLGGKNLLSGGDIAQLYEDLADETHVQELIDAFWPTLEPRQVLRELLESEDRIQVAASEYDDETQQALLREKNSAWASSDAALLDELAVFIGIADPEEAQAEEDRKWQEQIAEAQDALDILTGSASQDLDDGFDAEILMAHDVIDAETLAARQKVRDIRSTAERAQADYTWAYGHVVVDEAQELSPMEWRMVMRRCPSRWITIVGDTAQTGSPAGVDTWTETLEPFVKQRFRRHQLTINYRTPQTIMDEASKLLPIIAPEQTPSTSIRTTDGTINFYPSGTDANAIANTLQQQNPDRLIQIISAENIHNIKGLEFDHVILVEPATIIESSTQGWQDLYVALTRATQSLTIIGAMPNPEIVEFQ